METGKNFDSKNINHKKMIIILLLRIFCLQELRIKPHQAFY